MGGRNSGKGVYTLKKLIFFKNLHEFTYKRYHWKFLLGSTYKEEGHTLFLLFLFFLFVLFVVATKIRKRVTSQPGNGSGEVARVLHIELLIDCLLM